MAKSSVVVGLIVIWLLKRSMIADRTGIYIEKLEANVRRQETPQKPMVSLNYFPKR